MVTTCPHDLWGKSQMITRVEVSMVPDPMCCWPLTSHSLAYLTPYIGSNHHLVGGWTIHEPHLSKKNRPRCYLKSPTVQDVVRPIPGLINCAGVTGRWGLLSRAQNAVDLALIKDCEEQGRGCMHGTNWIFEQMSLSTFASKQCATRGGHIFGNLQ